LGVLAHHEGTVKTLLSAGANADVNAKDNFGFTPLLYGPLTISETPKL